MSFFFNFGRLEGLDFFSSYELNNFIKLKNINCKIQIFDEDGKKVEITYIKGELNKKSLFLSSGAEVFIPKHLASMDGEFNFLGYTLKISCI